MRNKGAWTVTFFLLLFTSQGCQDELEERYLNPDKASSPSIDKFFTGMLNNDRVRPAYWEISTFINWHIGVYTQAVGFLNSESMYQQNESYIQDRWNDFYRSSSNGSGVLSLYREIEKAYSLLPESEKKNNEIYVNAGKVILYDQLSQIVDLWGDVPFSEAGMLNKTGEIVYPKFDDALGIYIDAIESLEVIGNYFATVKLSQATVAAFTKQDILLNGNLNLWRRYANSLRLRLLMRISFYDEAETKEAVMNLLADEINYPMLDDGNYLPGEDDILLRPIATYAEDLHAAFTDWTNYPAPYFMLEKVLKPANDLRIPVLFDKYGTTVNNKFSPNAEFNAMPLNLSRVEQLASVGKYAIFDSTTFLYNSRLPGVVMTVAEVNFLKAEAFERWGGGDPALEYMEGIRNSVEFYFSLNQSNTTGKILQSPSDEEINHFLHGNDFLSYEGDQSVRLTKIWTQKWIHFGFLQAPQRWAEQRRTKTPELEFYYTSLTGFEGPPDRLTYPLSEKTLNTNYLAVSGIDKRDQKLFWDVK